MSEFPTCRRGHEFTLENTKIDKRGYKICVECKRQANREQSKRNKAPHPFMNRVNHR